MVIVFEVGVVYFAKRVNVILADLVSCFPAMSQEKLIEIPEG